MEVRKGSKRSGMSDRHVHRKSVESEDSDEDYVAEVEEIDDQSDELDSLIGDASEEISCFEAEEDEENEGRLRRTIKTRARKGSARCRKNGIKRPKKRRVMSDDDDDEEEEEEFTPDEENLEEGEEEEYRVPGVKTRKRRRTTLKESTYVKWQKRSTMKAGRKPCTKKRVNPSRLRSRAKSCGDEDVVERCSTLRGGNKEKPIRRKKLVTAGSESDSDSSDNKFTISEEEREQIREANMICGSVATNLRNPRSFKEDEAFIQPKTPPARKGKEKAEVIKKDVCKPVCGICLTEEGKNTVRGMLDCCSHFFCFACIFEWSRVETRCPLCKQRFASISKPAKCGKGFLRDIVVPVPERDQVYQPSEEELRDFLNPYDNVMCTECHHGGDDALMLLCDICDSPAHTYCVGLGREVPEGNWYCNGCRSAALGSSHSQTQDSTQDHSLSTGVSNGTSAYENMAEIDLNVTIPEIPVSQGTRFLSSPRPSGGNFQTPVSGVGVSTVSGRRLIHQQIQHLLSNRLSQISPVSDINALDNLVGWGANFTQQQNRTDIGPSHHVQYVDRLQENPYISVQDSNFIPGRMSHMMSHIGQPSTSLNGLVHSQIHWSGLHNLNVGVQSQILASEQLHPCSSRSSAGPEIGMAFSYNMYEEYANFAKQQIYSMVTSQLKSLFRDMNLGHDDYVEISRRSAHTIMAAYGLEPRRHDTYEVYPTICLHYGSILASPITGFCSVCFEAFVKDVVKQIVSIIVQPHRLGFRS